MKDELGIGLCNITKCCTEVCPEDIHITDNAIIPLKERVVDEFYDPLLMLVRKIRGVGKSLDVKVGRMEYELKRISTAVSPRPSRKWSSIAT